MRFLLQALEQAEQRRGFCAPNPAVGAVLVKEDRVIAVGAHWAAGEPHAEIVALREAGEAAKGATLYVSLEPCTHYGKTPPCTESIIQAGVKRVVFGFLDPHNLASQGQEKLIQASVECELLPLPEVAKFYHSYHYWLQHDRPWLTLKLALSADNKIAKANGESAVITGEACYQYTQRQRYRSDALLTTVQTILNDDPKMNARLPEKTEAKPLFILDSQLRLDPNAQIFKTAKSVTVYHAEGLSSSRDWDCVAVPCDQNGLDLNAVLADMGQRGFQDVWAEVGARAFRSFYQRQLINTLIFYRSKKRLGSEAMPAFSHFNPLEEGDWSWESLCEDEIARREFSRE